MLTTVNHSTSGSPPEIIRLLPTVVAGAKPAAIDSPLLDALPAGDAPVAEFPGHCRDYVFSPNNAFVAASAPATAASSPTGYFRRAALRHAARFSAALLTFLAGTVATAAEADLPQYWLKVGQELTYETLSEVSMPDGQAAASKATWQVWVVKQNANGSWRLILRHASTFQPPMDTRGLPADAPAGKANAPGGKANAPGGKANVPKPSARGGASRTVPNKAPASKQAARQPAAKSPAGGAAGQAAGTPATGQPPAGQPSAGQGPMPGFGEQVTFAYCDFSPDGAVAANPTLGYQFEVRQLLPRLPKSEAELNSGWAELDRSTQVGFRYRVKDQPDEDDDEPEWVILANRQSPVDDIYECRTQATYYFDGDRGLVDHIESKLEQSYGANIAATASTRLVGVEQFDEDWCKRLDEEMGHYFAVESRYQSLLKEAQRNSSDAEQLLIEASVLLQKAAAEITIPIVKEDLAKQAARHGAAISLAAKAARDRLDYIDLPAPNWQGDDLDGNARALGDYKGKVVLLHFWRRADGWSLRVLPQVEQLAEQFADQPVVVLGMNTDEKEADARFVVDKMGLAYPIVRADRFAEKYNVGGSVVFIIDQKGVVRDVYQGYSPTLKDDAASVIQGLLKEPPKEVDGKR